MTDEQLTPREKLFKLQEDTCKEALALMRKKNADYATSDDPLYNFRRFGPIIILARMDDKICRLQQILKKSEIAVENESVLDTLLDVINYAVLYRSMLSEQKSV